MPEFDHLRLKEAHEETERALDEVILVLKDVLAAEYAETSGLTEEHNRQHADARKRLKKVLVQRGLVVGDIHHMIEG